MPKAKSKSTHTKTQATKVSDESAPKPHGTKRKTIADAATIETEDLASSVENNAIVKEKRRKTGKKLCKDAYYFMLFA